MTSDLYQSVIQKAPFGFAYHEIILDDEGAPADYRFLEVNDAFRKLTGIQHENITGKKVSELLPGVRTGDFDWVAYYGRIVLEGGEEVFEQYSEPLGRWFKVHVCSHKKQFFSTTFTDISCEKLQNLNLEKINQRYRGIIDSQIDLFARVDKDNRFTYVNDAYCIAFGKSRKELIGSSFVPIVHEEDREHTMKEMEKLRAAPHRCRIEQRALTINGWRWFHWEDSAILNDEGEIIEIQGVGRDITELKEREHELNAYQKRLKLAHSFSNIGSWEYDIERKKLFWSAECEKLFGIDEGTFEGSFSDFMKRVHPDDQEYVLEMNKPITELKEGVPLYYEHRIVRDDGEVRWVRESAGVAYDENDKPAKIIGLVSDITKQKKDAEIIENEEKLRQIVDNIDGVFWLRSADRNNILYVSPKYQDIFGRTTKEAFRDTGSFIDYVHEEDKELVSEAHEEFLKTGNFTQEYRIRRPDGTNRWIHEKAFPVKNDQGDIIRSAGIARDITETKLLQISVKEELDFRTFLFERNKDGLVILNNDHKVVEANEEFCKMLGYSAEELKRMYTWDFDAEKTKEDILSGFDTSKDIDATFESTHLRKDGSTYDVEISAKSFHWKGQRLVVCTCRDISERKKAEIALKESEEKYRMLFNANKDSISIFYINDDGMPSNFIEMNEAGAEIIGYTKDDLLDMTISDIEEPVSPEEMTNNINALLSMGEANFETRVRKKDGSLIDIDVRAMLINYNKRPALLNISRDITKRKQTEQELIRAKESAEAASQLKTAFIDNISHEIRTPLNGIIGFGQLIAQANTTKEERLGYLSTLRKSTDRLIQTVTDFMDISKITSKNMKVNTGRFLLKEIMEEQIDRVKRQCAPGVGLRLELPEGHQNLMIDTDSELLGKVMGHLLGNAAKFTEKGNITLGFSLQEQALEFFVKDQGVGIETDKLEMIFEAFTQGDMKMTRGYEGSGLGLAITKGIVELLGGILRAESEKGKGSVFRFTIPCSQATGRETHHTPGTQKKQRVENPLILVAEDDLSNHEYLTIILKNAGCLTLHAYDGKEAVDLCRSHPDIDLVLMDIKMPIMNGLEATRQIKALRKDLPVVAVTAYVKIGEENLIAEAGCEEYYFKPFTDDDLDAVIHKYIG